MSIALWIVSGLLAFGMVGAGGMKLAVPRQKVLDKMGWAETWSDGSFKLLGLAELLGGIGVIVPYATGILPWLTPVAAVCLLILMLGAIKTHVDRKEPPAPPAVFAVLALVVALGRSGLIG